MPSNDRTVEEQDNSDIILSVLNDSPFKIRSQEEKLAILKKGRPLPSLNIIKRDSSKNCNRTFQSSWYDIHKWLCGSITYNKLFCWPCLLMRPETSSWCSTGNDDMKRFTSLATKHAICKSHLKAIREYDETRTEFSLLTEFSNELKFECKEEEEEDSSSDKTETDDINNLIIKKKITTETKTSLLEKSPDVSESDKVNYKTKPEITFKTWQELNKNTFPVSKSKFLNDMKLFKWKKKIAQQELKNARLTGEKLKIEIEVLKAKMEYYKSLKQD